MKQNFMVFWGNNNCVLGDEFMKFLTLAFLIATTASAYSSQGDECFKTFRAQGYDLNSSAQSCKGGVSDECFKEFRSKGYDLNSSAQSCKGGVSDVCFKEFRSQGYDLNSSAQSCKGF